MKNNIYRVRQLGGINQQYPQPDGSMSELSNWTIDERTNGWDNRIGYERYNPVPTNSFAPFSTTVRVDSLYLLSNRSRAQEMILLESAGTLYYVHDFGNTMSLVSFDTNRNVPANNELPTQYVAYASSVIIINGYNTPIKFYGWPLDRTSYGSPVSLSTDLGFPTIPSAPSPWQVHTDPTNPPNNNSVCIPFDILDAEGFGMGIQEVNKVNRFRYKVLFVSDTGSESPISLASTSVSWTTQVFATISYTYAVAIEIPIGGNNVVARKIYRTKNLGPSLENDETYYYLETIRNNTETLYYDYTRGKGLGSQAPDDSASIPFPALTCTIGAVFAQCLFVNGGTANGSVLYFSNPNRPDQFGALDFISVGSSHGGDITALHPYYNTLLVFREHSIEVLVGAYGSFQMTTISTNIGTTAANTITTIPDAGVLFLSYDGVYLFTGGGAGVYGGAVADIKKISSPIHSTINSLNKAVLSRATASYSHDLREWHCYLATEGAEKPNLGIVLHTQNTTWTTRQGFPVGSLICDSNGYLIFGHHTGLVSAGDPAGLFVMSNRRSAGQALVADTIVDNTAPTATLFTKWHDFGDAMLKKKVHYVVLYIMTTGDLSLPIKYFIDFDYDGIDGKTMKQQRADHTDQFVYDKAIIGTSTWEDRLVTLVRYPVAINSCTHFAFQVSTTSDCTIVGYDIHYTHIGTKMISGKTP